MSRVLLRSMSPWNRWELRIPPDSVRAWIRLAIWELWMGALVSILLGFGLLFIVTSPDRIVTVSDLSTCYGPPPVAVPCERIVYSGGILNAAFTTLFGLTSITAAAWFLWELWAAAEPKPVTDDFLRLLNDSFGRNWWNPFTWPWSRAVWAYGITSLGAALTVGLGMAIWTFIATSHPTKAPTTRIETFESFRPVQ